MVSLSIADAGPVEVNGLDLAGPVTVEGDSFTLLGETITSGVWMVGKSAGELELMQTGVIHPLAGLVSIPLSLVIGFAVALAAFKFSR